MKCPVCLRRPSLESLSTNLCEDCFERKVIQPARQNLATAKKMLLEAENELTAQITILQSARALQFKIVSCFQCNRRFDSNAECEAHEARCRVTIAGQPRLVRLNRAVGIDAHGHAIEKFKQPKTSQPRQPKAPAQITIDELSDME